VEVVLVQLGEMEHLQEEQVQAEQVLHQAFQEVQLLMLAAAEEEIIQLMLLEVQEVAEHQALQELLTQEAEVVVAQMWLDQVEQEVAHQLQAVQA
tara:strand:+ start:453 stop:737 length:285 start_codon:yes stop_codon:yes gene_type:complete